MIKRIKADRSTPSIRRTLFRLLVILKSARVLLLHRSALYTRALSGNMIILLFIKLYSYWNFFRSNNTLLANNIKGIINNEAQ